METDEDNVINNVEPLWTKAPAELKDDDYKQFYRTLFPMNDEPLFWIHLNVDYPFHLTGILYFPRVKNNIELQRNKIQLYCNQVFVTDQSRRYCSRVSYPTSWGDRLTRYSTECKPKLFAKRC